MEIHQSIHLEIEKKYLLKKSEVELVEKKCLEISLPQISHQYEKNQILTEMASSKKMMLDCVYAPK